MKFLCLLKTTGETPNLEGVFEHFCLKIQTGYPMRNCLVNIPQRDMPSPSRTAEPEFMEGPGYYRCP